MSKAVAVHAIVLVIIIAMFAIVAILTFSGYLGIQRGEVGKAACITKAIRFCAEWLTKDFSDTNKPNWSTMEPTNCDQFDVKEPKVEDCKGQYKKE